MNLLEILGPEKTRRILGQVQQKDHRPNRQDPPRIHAHEIDDRTQPSREPRGLAFVALGNETAGFGQAPAHPGHPDQGREAHEVKGTPSTRENVDEAEQGNRESIAARRQGP